MVKPPTFDSNGMKRGAWSKEEDERLSAFVHEYGHNNWRLLPSLAGKSVEALIFRLARVLQDILMGIMAF